MSAIDDFVALLETTEVVKQILKTMKEEPAYILKDICWHYYKNGGSMPDHQLQFTGYMGEVALKALMSAGLIKKQSGGSVSLYTYEPTEEGLRQYDQLKDEGFFKRG